MRLYLVLLLLVVGVFSGCVSDKIPVNQSKMADSELINNFCQINGFDRGITEIQDPYRFYEYWRDNDVGCFGYDSFNRKIICVKVETKITNTNFDYDELYGWIKNV